MTRFGWVASCPELERSGWVVGFPELEVWPCGARVQEGVRFFLIYASSSCS